MSANIHRKERHLSIYSPCRRHHEYEIAGTLTILDKKNWTESYKNNVSFVHTFLHLFIHSVSQ